MKYVAGLIVSLLVCACSTAPKNEPSGAIASPEPRTPAASHASPIAPKVPVARPSYDIIQLLSQVGLERDSKDLGYAEKPFDGCQVKVKDEKGKCGNRYLTVVHFRLVCRDSEETTESIATNLTPLYSEKVKWKIAGSEGMTKTDGDGYGQVRLVSARPSLGQRFVLIVGKQFLGLDISEVRQIVVPNYWCNQATAANDDDLSPVVFVSDVVKDEE